MTSIGIFRHQLFKTSESFIGQQVSHLRHYRPIYIGRERLGAAPTDLESVAISDLPGQRSIMKRIWQVATRDVRPYKELLRQGYDIRLLHAHFGVDGVYALPLARQLHVPLVTTIHGFDATTSALDLVMSGSPAWVNYLIFRHALARRGALFLCVSKFIKERACTLGFPPDRTHVHYIGIDTDALRPRHVKEERPLVLHVARLVEKKGTEYLLRAFERATKRVPHARLCIIGDGPLKEKLRGLTVSLSIDDRVKFLGALPHGEVLKKMRKAAVLAVPSVRAHTGDSEGLPTVVLEASAIGVPVVGTLHGGIPEAIVDSETGYLVAERDVEALSDRLERLMCDKPLRQQMGAHGRTLMEEHFDIQRQTAILETLYDGLLQ